MDNDHYGEVKISEDWKTFLFVSVGPQGDLLKIVRFIPFQLVPDAHNLALGTIRNNLVDYFETTDNGDRDKVIATIFQIALTFSVNYPNQKIHVRGRNAATTRLYRVAINHEYDKLVRVFKIYGGIDLDDNAGYRFELFKNTIHYDAFLFERR